MPVPPAPTLVVVVGPTGSGKSSLALRIAEVYGGEILSCDSVAVYRGLDVGSAKPSPEQRRRVPHHGLDLLTPDQPSTAGDFARMARAVLESLRTRRVLPILAGGTSLYLRAILEGLAPAPPRDDALRARLRAHAARRGPGSLSRVLRRCDPKAATLIHPNDTPKLIRSLETTLLGHQPQTELWAGGRAPLQGFRLVQLGLDPARTELYARINQRAASMFRAGLLEETAAVAAAYGRDALALGSLGYAQALAVLEGRQGLQKAIGETQQGHRNYAKRQMTWFRRDPRTQWLHGFGDEDGLQRVALQRVAEHLMHGAEPQ